MNNFLSRGKKFLLLSSLIIVGVTFFSQIAFASYTSWPYPSCMAVFPNNNNQSLYYPEYPSGGFLNLYFYNQDSTPDPYNNFPDSSPCVAHTISCAGSTYLYQSNPGLSGYSDIGKVYSCQNLVASGQTYFGNSCSVDLSDPVAGYPYSEVGGYEEDFSSDQSGDYCYTGGGGGGGNPPADFSITLGSASTVQQGQAASFPITLQSENSMSGTVNLSQQLACPTNSTCSFSPSSVFLGSNGTGSATLTVTTSASTPAGPYSVDVNGTWDTTSHDSQNTLTVTGPACSNWTYAPTANMDVPSNGSTVSGTVAVGGWVIDNQYDVEGAVANVQVYVDGVSIGNANTYARPDVCAVYPGRVGCPNVGYGINWDTTKYANGSHTIQYVATDSDCPTHTGRSYLYTVTVNNVAQAPTADIKVTDPTFGVSNSNGPITTAYGDTVQLSWTSTNATTCTVRSNQNADAWSGTSNGGVNTSSLTANSTVYTLSCTGAGGTTQDTVTINIPPAPTLTSDSCPSPGTTAYLSWTMPNGYTNVYVRANTGQNNWNYPSSVVNTGAIAATSYNFSTSPNQTYSWWVQTENPSNGAWSQSISDGNLLCSATPVNGSCGSACNQTYPYGSTGFGSDSFCSSGTVSPSNPSFPSAGNCTNWTCLGQNGGSNSSGQACQAAQPLTQYSVTISKSSGGSVNSGDNTIMCGNNCSANYNQGSTVQLTATPQSSSWKFVGWTGNCSGSANPYSLVVNGNETCTAVFAPKPFQYQEF